MCIHAYMHTYIHACMHTYIQLKTYVREKTRSYMRMHCFISRTCVGERILYQKLCVSLDISLAWVKENCVQNYVYHSVSLAWVKESFVKLNVSFAWMNQKYIKNICITSMKSACHSRTWRAASYVCVYMYTYIQAYDHVFKFIRM